MKTINVKLCNYPSMTGVLSKISFALFILSSDGNFNFCFGNPWIEITNTLRIVAIWKLFILWCVNMLWMFELWKDKHCVTVIWLCTWYLHFLLVNILVRSKYPNYSFLLKQISCTFLIIINTKLFLIAVTFTNLWNGIPRTMF